MTTRNDSARLSDSVLETLRREARVPRGERDSAGLRLIDMPTGYGKSYAAVRFLAEFSLNPENEGRSIFYITGQKKNLPKRDEVIDSFKAAGSASPERDVDRDVIWVRSIIDMMVENATDELSRRIPRRFKRSEWNDLLAAANQYRATLAGADFEPLRDAAEEKLRVCERRFRDYIANELARPEAQGNGSGDSGQRPLNAKRKLRRLKYDEEWQWLPQLYPTTLMREKRVFLMSVNKFLVSNVTLVENGFMFLDDKITRNAVVIIDEFDASKLTLLDDIVNRSIRGKVDPIALVKQLHSTFEESEFPKGMLANSKKRGSSNLLRVKRIVQDDARVVRNAYEGCNLKYSFKSDEEPGQRDFMFYDHEYCNTGKGVYLVETDEDAGINRLVPAKRKDSGTTLNEVLGRIRGALGYAQTGISYVAENYCIAKNEQRSREEAEYSYESAVRSVLDHFGIVGGSAEQFMRDGAVQPFRGKAGHNRENADLRGDFSVYERGIHFVSLVNSEEHDFRTRVEMCAMQDSPEKTLLKLCERSLVIGMSATASFDSVLCNYDLDYLKNMLGDSYRVLATEEAEAMREAFERQNEGYKDVKIEVELAEDVRGELVDGKWRELFEDEEVAEAASAAIRAACQSDDNRYAEARYQRVCWAFKRFMEMDDVRSMLCLTMRVPKKDSPLEPEVLKRLFDLVLCGLKDGASRDSREYVRWLSGSKKFEAEFGVCKDELEAGKKIFLVASYSTVGTGVNIQYRAPKDVDTVRVYPLDDEPGTKDFDAIYLDRPTNVAPYIPGGDMTEAELIKNLFSVAELAEHLEMSESDYENAYKAFLGTYASQKNRSKKFPKLKDRPSAKAYVARYVNQAVGRICRTNLKNPTVHILADAGLVESMDLYIADGKLVNNEYEALVRALKEKAGGPPEPFARQYETGASRLSNAMNGKIVGIVKNGSWSAGNQAFWKEMRETVLKWPTLPPGAESPFVKRIYAECPEAVTSYTYDEIGDYGKVTVSFDRSIALSKTVSAVEARLPQLMAIDGAREHFEAMGWATEWEASNHLMTPVLFNNIYKGALGEAVGKYLLERYIPGFELEEIAEENEFEKFDYRIKGTRTYVDFKHWAGPSGADSKSEIARICEKRDIIGAARVLVVNILNSEDGKWETEQFDNGRIMTVPYLYDPGSGLLSNDFIRWIVVWLQRGD